MNTPYLVVPTALMEVLREREMLDEDGRLKEEYCMKFPMIPVGTAIIENRPILSS